MYFKISLTKISSRKNIKKNKIPRQTKKTKKTLKKILEVPDTLISSGKSKIYVKDLQDTTKIYKTQQRFTRYIKDLQDTTKIYKIQQKIS